MAGGKGAGAARGGATDVATPHDQRIAAVIAAFERAFGGPPAGIAEAPGRVNLIGEHVDYNDGLVLPFAIDRSVIVALRRADGSSLRACAVDCDEAAAFTAGAQVHEAGWRAYIAGVIEALRDAHHAIAGCDLAFAGDVPQGAGLSSSAALEVALMGALRDALALPLDDVTLARLCQRAENEYVGVQSGIMDQFAATLSKRYHALLIDCRSLDYTHVPLRLSDAGLRVVIVNSAIRRDLASSAYNERRRECEAAVAELRALLGRPDLASLRDVAPEELDAAIAGDPPTPLRRARHVVREIARVRDAVAALDRDDYAALGALMNASHASLRDDFTVSSGELDLLTTLARSQPYVLGARLTGAGFGGCTVQLVRADALDAFERDVVRRYNQKTGLKAETYVTGPRDGLRAWRL